jgi:hypothetical protein
MIKFMITIKVQLVMKSVLTEYKGQHLYKMRNFIYDLQTAMTEYEYSSRLVTMFDHRRVPVVFEVDEVTLRPVFSYYIHLRLSVLSCVCFEAVFH